MNKNFFKKISYKEKIFYLSIIFIIIVNGIIYFIIWPILKNITKINEETKQERINLETQYFKGQKLSKLTKNLEKIEPKLAMLEKTFIAKDRILEFVTLLENLANQNNVQQKINLISDKETKEGDYKKIPLQIEVVGEFPDLISYLIALEKMGYYININSIDIISMQNKGQQKEIIISINSNTYWK